MSRQDHTYSDAPPIEAGQQIAHLRHMLGMVEAIAASAPASSGYSSLDEAARISVAYDRGLPISRKRFDALAEETLVWAEVGLNALRHAERQSCQPRAAAAQLARELDAALRALSRIIDRV